MSREKTQDNQVMHSTFSEFMIISFSNKTEEVYKQLDSLIWESWEVAWQQICRKPAQEGQLVFSSVMMVKKKKTLKREKAPKLHF